MANTNSLYAILGQSGKFGYEIQIGRSRVKQDHAPALNGLYYMTEAEAQQLADYICSKVDAGLSWSVEVHQVENLWDGVKTAQQLINEELGV